jgi:16S rRNA (adenine1518-N6/adenine1519-N6)-dimethyltransferase
MPELTDLNTIRALCEKYDFALSKGFGQNFIINPGVCPKIVEASGIDKRYGVIEVGPGIGVLTKELAKRAAKVVAIEVDTRLPPVLAETLAEFDNVKVVLQDVLTVDLHKLIAEEFPGMPVAVCANLPYYITSPIVMKLLGEKLPIESLTVMVQKEAAERLAAAPGSRESGAISCAVSYYAQPRLLFSVQPGSFYPAPKVTSAVVKMEVRPTPAVAVEDEEGYFRLVRAAFGQRRKTAVNAIASGLNLPKEQVSTALESAGFDVRIRPEKLTLEDFAAIQKALAARRNA